MGTHLSSLLNVFFPSVSDWYEPTIVHDVNVFVTCDRSKEIGLLKQFHERCSHRFAIGWLDVKLSALEFLH